MGSPETIEQGAGRSTVWKNDFAPWVVVGVLSAAAVSKTATAADAPAGPGAGTAPSNTVESSTNAPDQNWNWHAQNTDIVQGFPSFPSKYSAANSLPSSGETRETVSVDLYGGIRLWQGAEAHIDGLMWQGFGLHNTLGAEGFPNGEAFRLGTAVPNVNIPRLFIRQTIGFGGPQEDVDDDQLTLAGKQDVSRLTLTLGKFSVKDIFDNNAYANDPRTQFMNWAFMANEAWDYPADSLGYITGFAAELNQPVWTLRYGFFQMPRVSNGTALDYHFLKAWGMVTELERRWSLGSHPGTVRLLAYLNSAHMGSYQEAVNNYNLNPAVPANIAATRDYRYKYGFGLNLEHEIAKDIGIFSRLGWSNGRTEGWVFSDVDYAATVGLSIKGEPWHRPDDIFGLAGALEGLSHVHQEFFADGGMGILAGDGALNYSWEKDIETYYDFKIWKTIHGALDYQFIADPAFNQDRGPVSVFAARVHWEF